MGFFDDIAGGASDLVGTVFDGAGSAAVDKSWWSNPSLILGGLTAASSLLSGVWAQQAADEKADSALEYQKERDAIALVEAQKNRDLQLLLASMSGGGGGGQRQTRGFETGVTALLKGAENDIDSFGNLISGSVNSLVGGR